MSELMIPPSMERFRRLALLTGAGGLLLCIIGWIFSAEAFYRSYLFAWVFFVGITAGSMAWTMMHHLVGGGWGRAIQRIVEAAAMNLPLMLLLFIPIVFGLRWLYPWADAVKVSHDDILRHKAAFLNPGFWTLRALIYFGLWITLTVLLVRGSTRYDQSRSLGVADRMRRLSAAGLVIYMLTMSLAGLDWIMSREPHYYSTIFGFIMVVGQALSALLVAVIVLTLLVTREPLRSFVTLGHFNDLGNLMLTCVILWAYVAFAQFLITWMGNIQEEVKWYWLRTRGFYGALAAILIGLHFFAPFLLLLSKELKRRPEALACIAAGLLFLRLIDIYWMVVPTGGPVRSINRYWLNIAALVGIGGLWIAAFLWHLGRRPLLAESEHEEPSTAMEHAQDPETGPHGERHAHPA